MNLNQIKRRLLAPYILYMRHKERKEPDLMKKMLEAAGYSPAFYRLRKAYIQNPDILIEAPNLGPDSLIFDVGAYDGDWSARVFKKYQARIYAFEVEPNCCARIAQRFESNPKIRCFNFGLGEENANLWLTRAGMGSTLYPYDNVGVVFGRVEVPVRDIVEVIDELGSPEIDLMKINIEGGEYGLLERLIAADRTRHIRCIMVQFHEWIDGAYRRRNTIRKALKTTHEIAWDYPFCWELWTRKQG